jgi:hypothetical protein
MPGRLLERMRNAIWTGVYDVTCQAVEAMAQDGAGILDVEHPICSYN